MQKVIIQHLDDLDGSEADGTTRFSLDGISYEVDLSAAHREALERIYEPYVAAARRTGKPRAVRSPAKTTAKHAGSGHANGNRHPVTNDDIRRWAVAQGYTVKSRGRIPVNIVDMFHGANHA